MCTPESPNLFFFFKKSKKTETPILAKVGLAKVGISPHGVVSSVATVDVCLGFTVDLCLMFSHRASR